MADAFIAEIRIVGFNFAPTGWAFCNGTILPISQNTALFSLLGTIYGGNGQTTFALPNLQGRMPLAPGQGPGLSPRSLGESAGVEVVTLLASEIPSHTHSIPSSSAVAPTAGVSGAPSLSSAKPYHPGPADVSASAGAVSAAGANQPHNNMPPYLAMNFIIALQGIFPPRP